MLKRNNSFLKNCNEEKKDAMPPSGPITALAVITFFWEVDIRVWCRDLCTVHVFT